MRWLRSAPLCVEPLGRLQPASKPMGRPDVFHHCGTDMAELTVRLATTPA